MSEKSRTWKVQEMPYLSDSTYSFPSFEKNDTASPAVDYSKVKIGMKTVEDAIYKLGDFYKANPTLADKKFILDAISKLNYEAMRQISDFFYKTSGIYNRLCRYLAYMYRYDWYLTPYVDSDYKKTDKILDSYNKVLNFLDNFQVKRFFGEVALKVIKNGCYYGYLTYINGNLNVQELPPRYSRSRYNGPGGIPLVEFNMKFFDQEFSGTETRDKMLKIFGPEFQKGYRLYKAGKLQPTFVGDTAGWYMLEADNAIKFNINGEDFPSLIAVIPAIIDLDDVRALDKKKVEQQLLKIIIQKSPLDKNGDPVFDWEETRAMHNNAVRMIDGKSIGVQVLTTFADVEVADLTSSSATTAQDDGMDRIKQAVFDAAGISQMQFNTDGNIALEKSILNDEAALYNLIQQFEAFLNKIIQQFNTNPKKLLFKVQLLGTTIYNYKDLAKLYKEQVTLGYSKLLPQVALGQSQSSVLASVNFENEILDLANAFVPPAQSSTMSNKNSGSSSSNSNTTSKAAGTSNTGGRPTKESQGESVTEKTIQNKESQS